ncbi:MAG TPA: DsbA family protein [Gammaproteobacteria bacterium]
MHCPDRAIARHRSSRRSRREALWPCSRTSLASPGLETPGGTAGHEACRRLALGVYPIHHSRSRSGFGRFSAEQSEARMRLHGSYISAHAAVACLAFALQGCGSGTPSSADAVDSAILAELREIRAVLERLEARESSSPAVSPPRPSTLTIPISGRPSLGEESAPVVMAAFVDYQCPYCRAFATTTLKEIERAYVASGDVRFVLIDMPLPIHSDAQTAAEAAHCAGSQGRYWEMHDRLFANGASLGMDALLGHAREMGLDMQDFSACLQEGRHRAYVADSLAEANRLGITGTPTFAIGRVEGDELVGNVVRGAQPFSVFQSEIKKWLQTAERE